MVDTLGFTDAVAGAPAYSGRMLRQTNGVLLAGATSARPLGARSGVRPGTPASTVTATSTTWTCQPFAGVLDGQTAAEAGPYPFAFDAVATGAVTAADASNPRVDIIYVLVEDPSEDASSVPAATRKYLAGTAGAVPVAPATPAGALLIAQINVPKVGAGSPTVTWVAPYMAAAGGVVHFPSQVVMDATLTLPAGTVGEVGNKLSVFDGSAWRLVGVTPVVPSVAAGSGTISVDPVTGKISLTTVGSSFTLFGLPTDVNRHKIVLDLTSAGSCLLTAQFTDASGTPVATGYDYGYRYSDGAASLTSGRDFNQSMFRTDLYSATTRRLITLDLSQLARTVPTIGTVEVTDTLVTGGIFLESTGRVYQRAATAHAGIKFILSASTVSGIVYVETGEPN